MTIMVSLEEIIGRVIRRERQERRLTIKELGDKAGLSEIYVGEIERGQKYPSSKVLESLATALEIDLADLLELMAEEMRYEREPQLTTNAIGFTIPSGPGQPRRLVVKKMVNMLDEGAVESLADFSADRFRLIFQRRKIHAQQGQNLPGAIVELAGDAPSLFVLGVQKLRGKLPQSSIRGR